MTERENHFEQPISSVDEQLASALQQLEVKIVEAVRSEVDADAYEEYEALHLLNASLDDTLDDEDQTLRMQRREAAIEQLKSEAARKVAEDPESPFDEDEGRIRMEAAYKDAALKMIAERALTSQSNDEVILAFGEVTDQLIDELETLLANRYPELAITSIDEGSITFELRGLPSDQGDTLHKKLLIQFTAQGQDIATEVAYSYIPVDFLVGTPFVKPLDVMELNGEVEHIPIDTLKADTVRALHRVLENTNL